MIIESVSESANYRRRDSRADAASAGDRLPPNAPDAERGVLSCILQSPRECLVEAANRLRTPMAFYDQRHRVVFQHLLALQDAGSAIDTITLGESLHKEENLLEQVGGYTWLGELYDAAPSAGHLEAYLDLVFDCWLLRRMIATCSEAVSDIYAHEGEITQLVAKVQNAILELPTPYAGGPRHTSAYVAKLDTRIDSYTRGQGIITGLRTGFAYWDKFSSGLHEKETIIIGGDPGSGKTTLAMNVAENVAVDLQKPVGVLSLEMSAEDLILRMVCSRTGVNFHKLRTGYAVKEDLDLIKDALPHLMSQEECPMFIDDASGLTMHEVRSRLRAMKYRHGIVLAVVDYLQLISLTKEQMFLGPAAGYADVARGLQQAAKELDIPIIVLSQLSNEGRKRGKKERPKLTDFRETGAIGDVANFAGILWRPWLGDEEEQKQREAIAADPMGKHELQVFMEVVKNKNGPSNTSLQFRFLRWCMHFEDLQHPKITPSTEAGS